MKRMVLTVTVDKLPVRISRTKEGVEWIIFNNLVICYPLSSDGKSEGEGSLDETRRSYETQHSLLDMSMGHSCVL